MPQPSYPPEMMQGDPAMSSMQGGGQDINSLNDVARPSHEDEDLEVLQGCKAMAAMAKQLIQQVQSGPVEDVLVGILSKLTALQKKYDATMAQAQNQGGQ